jgi:hypothetical protein
MAIKKRRLARLTPDEDKWWVFLFCYFLDDEFSDAEADARTWIEMCDLFPRLRGYGGCLDPSEP